jgi:hypothetical protein
MTVLTPVTLELGGKSPVRNQTAGVVHQVTRDIECLRFQLDTLFPAVSNRNRH